MASSALYDAASLAWMYWILDAREDWQRWNHTSDEIFSSIGRHARSSLYLSNKIEFALAEGAAGLAAEWLDRARSEYPEIVTPRSKAVERAFAIRISLLTGQRAESTVISELRGFHEAGKMAGLHDPVAECYWHALVSAGRRAEADAMIDSYIASDRRDRFPFRWPHAAA